MGVLMTETKSLRLTQEKEQSRFLAKTYAWMAFALIISAVTAFVTSQSQALLRLLFSGRAMGFMILAIAELILVFAMSARIRTMSVASAVLGFLLYSVMNGMTLSSIFLVFKIDSIAYCFLTTAILFMVMSIWGFTTKRNLNTFGRYLMMAVFGLIIAGLVGWIISRITGAPLAMLDVLISVATVIIFTGLTAYDAQKIVKTASHARDNDDYKKVSIMAALELYLDFINILLALLRLFGRRGD